ncbi:putative NAD(P)-binding Rossmann-fold superfamily protein [Hibiscus syriacus]|uniref:NAD(P)-binding Rossmann-fold superfamily protein n=1 Tax=Hibiscus syriacus TaxID=106335 RepID=A0A6A2Y998_HIBSY|nr:putative NAD(P)-binding Rossmann-fold superfamily protein [Hibiscus syriacus]
MEEDDKGTVCVTGGTGFIASFLIKRLLHEGYSVRTTVRSDPGNERDLSFLTTLPGAAERLEIFSADLNDLESFDAAIEGCKGVFHLATPINFDVSEEVFIERANGRDVETMDESFWTDIGFARGIQNRDQRCYIMSKTLPEKEALEFGARHGLDVVTVIPSLVVGPFICPKLPASVQTTLALILGLQDQYPYILNVSMVHVDDIARAHIFLLEYPDAKGRYNCSAYTMSLQKMYEFLRAKYPEFPMPTPESIAEIKGERCPVLSSKKLLDAGFEFNYGVDEMFDDSIKCCKEKVVDPYSVNDYIGRLIHHKTTDAGYVDVDTTAIDSGKLLERSDLRTAHSSKLHHGKGGMFKPESWRIDFQIEVVHEQLAKR